jgi:hypothetical protein
MGKNIDKRLWGVLGKQQTYFSPQKQVEGKTKTPLNANAFDSWDAKRSRFKRIDGYDIGDAVQQGGVVPQVSSTPIITTPTPTPSITPTMTNTPSITPSQTPEIDCIWNLTDENWENNSNDWNVCAPVLTPTMTQTNTQTQTITPTPSITPTMTNTPTPSITPTMTNTPTTTTTSTPTPSAPSFNPSSLSASIWVDFSDASTITTRTSGSQSFITRITNKGTDTSLTAFTQSTAANQPLVAVSTVFSGTSISAATCSNDFLVSNANTPNSNSWTVAMVIGEIDGTSTEVSAYGMSNASYQKNTYWHRNSTSSRVAYFNNGAGTYYRTDITNPVLPTWSGQSYIEFVSTTGGSQVDYYFTNTSAMTESVVAGSNYTQNTPGASSLTLFNSGGSTANVQVGEMIFLNRELTTTERTNLLNYFRTKWGLTY